MGFPHQAISRRQFHRLLGAAGIGYAAFDFSAASLSADPAAPTLLMPGKDPRLIVHSQQPIVLETPTELLVGNKLTPVDRIFVRNCQLPAGQAALAPVNLEGWKLDLSGLISRKLTIDARELEQFDQTDYMMVLQCSGNGRSRFAEAAPVQGTAWGNGGMACVQFSGVPVQRVLEKYGIEVDPSARFIAAEGSDSALPGKDDFEHSLPLDAVLNRSILAIKLNGKPLPAIHGGPLRLVTPGVYGTMNVKWLRRLRFERDESKNYYQVPQYRVPHTPIAPGAKFENTHTNSRSNWDMKIRSVILTPMNDAELPAGKLRILGVAFNDGKAAIESVLISQDSGQTWKPAQLERPKSLYAWTPFEFLADMRPGKHTMWSRATDTLGRSQPLDGSVFWNSNGYEWNGVDKVTIQVS